MILDTDIGTDVDDALALALALKSEEIMLKGVTTAYGHVDYRARVARKLLRLCDREDVKVYAGIGATLLRKRQLIGYGHEVDEEMLTDERYNYESMHAVDFIIDTVLKNPHQITLVCIAPMTNIAAAIIREPKVAELVKQIVLMGGVTRLGDNGVELPVLEYNVKCDPESASVVFSSKAPIYMVGLDVTTKVKLTEKEQELLAGSDQPLNRELAKLITRWQRLSGKDWCAMHDPLAVSLLFDPSLVKFRKMDVQVEYDHRHPSGQTVAVADAQSTIHVGLEVETDKFMNQLMRRLLAN
ncbi:MULTISPECIES: nucleoside hydrolase [unclassified Paenibacillus]|uniref:nucleoside hydrolase n=1 Tax=unclassified Paenibacillus TaxID=185978 RepID=UPI00362DDC2D